MDWDERNRRKRLREENAGLRKKLGISKSQYNLDDTTPEMENQFLKNILSFNEMEDGPQIEIRTIFPVNFEFPLPEHLNDEELEDKLDDIEDIFMDNNIFLDLVEKCPDRIIYKYILNEVLSDKIAVSRPTDLRYHISGCDGWCPDCFQQPYCDTWKDIWDENELKSIRKEA